MHRNSVARTEVPKLEVSEETVVNDKAGLHLNSGPYMLIYSSGGGMPSPVPESSKAAAPFWSDHHLVRIMHGFG